MNTIANTAFAAALLAPGIAWAEASNFNYVEAGYLQGEIDGFDVDGWGLEGSVELTPRVFVQGGYDEVQLDEDRPGFDIEADLAYLGVGYVFGENETGNFYGKLAYLDAGSSGRVAGFAVSDSDDGYALGLGTRFNLGPQAELRFEVDYSEVGGDDSLETSGALVYSFTPRFAGVAEYSRDSDFHTVGLSLRFYFR